MKVEIPTYKCDAAGCRSTCTLAPGEPDPADALTKRGWRVIGGSHLCPAHKSDPAKDEPTDPVE